jgi:prefoldin subunit 5
MNYAYTVGGGHSGHLNNAAHTARLLSQELRRLKATIDELNDMQLSLRRELATYKEREQTMGWNQS